jgi:hypothetical protein
MRAADNVADREAHDEAARDEVVYDPNDEAEVVDDTSQEAEVVDDTSPEAGVVDDEPNESAVVTEERGESAVDERVEMDQPVVDDAGVIEPVATEQPETEPSHDGVVGLWPVADAEAIRGRWREVQLRFVDDPGTAADEAGKLVDDAARVLVTTIESRRSELGGWRDNPTGDTEQLRLVVQGYREFMDQVLGV